jgi:hypothetical protein
MFALPLTNNLASSSILGGHQADFSSLRAGETSSSSPFSLRNTLIGELPQLSAPLTEREAGQVAKWDKYLPIPQWGPLHVAWIRALESYGTPAEFTQHMNFSNEVFALNSMNYRAFSIRGFDFAARERLGKVPTPYQSDANMAPHLRADCALCGHIDQGNAAMHRPESIANNVLFRLGSPGVGTALVIPNRFPMVPLASLWLRDSHDSMETRISALSKSCQVQSSYPREAGRTRGALVSGEELLLLGQFCKTIGFTALRNHVVDGASIPSHDHWHLWPNPIFPDDHLNRLELTSPLLGELEIGVLKKNPFATYFIGGRDLAQSAFKTARIINKLELENEVFTVQFIAGRFLISPRLPTYDHRIQIGAGIETLCLDPVSETFRQNLQYLPQRLIHSDYARRQLDFMKAV